MHQRGSTFPLTNVMGADVLLWQDYSHDEGTVAFSDLLGMLTGESIGIRIPGRVNAKFRNKAPLFYSGRAEIQCYLRDPNATVTFNEMMSERFTLFQFVEPLPKADRVAITQCAACYAKFVLTGDLSGPSAASSSATASTGLTFV